jgi:hypothetical protein
MSDFPGQAPPSNVVVSTYDRRYGVWPMSTSDLAWPTANLAIYCPVLVPEPTIVTKMAVQIGSATSGNLDLGVYDEAGVRLVSTGSTAVGSASTLQVEDVTDTLLTPGTYYLAIACDNTTARFLTGGFAAQSATGYAKGLRQETSAMPLPSTATLTSTTAPQRAVVITCTTRIPVL